MKQKSSFTDLKLVLDQLIGNDNILSNNVLFIDFTGSHEKGQLLSQMWYWAGKTKDPLGWFYKSYAQWYEETRVPEHSVRRFVKQFVEKGFVYTKFKKVGNHPMLHYRLDKDALIAELVTFCKANKLQPLHGATLNPDNLQPSIEADNLQASLLTEKQRLQTESEPAPAQFLVTSIALETIPTVEENIAPGAAEPDWMDVARQMEAHAKGEGAAQWRFMCEAQGYKGDIMPIVSNWAGKASKYQLLNWKSEFRKLQTWLKTESRADFKAQQRPGTSQPATFAGFSLNQYKPKQ